jgi:hypothetical protein
MAGQPPEPSFQPSGQDQGLTQGRPAWQQQPSYNPPPAAPGGQPGYGAAAYPSQDPPQPYAPPEPQAYPGADQGYPAQDQTYAGQGQDYQAYQGYQPPSYGAQPGQGQGQGAGSAPPQWQGIAGVKPGAARTKQTGEKGFLGSLFDYSFNSMITPKVVKGLYVLASIMTVFGLVVIYGIGRTLGHGATAGIIDVLIFGVPFALLSLGLSRLFLEAGMILFQIHGELKKIRENTDTQG